ncbi:MAG: type III-A CRISPR-associated protein Csm2 [Planctomycetota bacterium]
MTDAENPAPPEEQTPPPASQVPLESQPSAPEPQASAPEPQAAPPEPAPAGAEAADAKEAATAPEGATADAEAHPRESRADSQDAGRPKKRRRKKAGPGTGPAPAAPVVAHGGRQFVEDQIDREAERLARDARTIPTSRLRPLGIMAQEVRRMAASGDPGDAREARRALVLMKSKIAYLAGREQGRERSAFLKVREFVFRGVDGMVRNRDTPDPKQLRNFLDQVEAFVGYHRFHTDERRRD